MKIVWEGYFEEAEEIYVFNTTKARRTAQRYTDHTDTSKLTTGRCTALQNQNIVTSSPTKKTSQDTNPAPSIGADSKTKKNYDLENFVCVCVCVFSL